MADIDLATALNMFKSGTQDLMFSRALDNANEQVQQIKATEANDQQQRAALQQIANGLTMRMAQIGVPATTMQNVSGAIMGPQLQNANQMAAWANQTGNSQLLDSATRQQTFEQNPASKIAQIQARAETQNPMRLAVAEQMKEKRWADMQTNLDKRIDTQTTRFGNLAKLQTANNRLRDAMTLLEGDINPSKLHELGRTFDSILSQGSATIEGSKSVLPNTLQEDLAKWKEKLTSKPQTMNIPEFKEFYRDSFNRLQEVNKQIIKEGQKDVIKSSTGPAKYNPEGFETWAQARGLNVKVDRKSGKIDVLDDVTDPPPTRSNNAMIPIMVKGPDGRPMKALKDSITGKLYAAPR